MNSAAKVSADIALWKAEGIEKADLMVNIAEDMLGWPYAWGATGQQCTVANRKARMNSSKISAGDKELIRKHCQILNGSRTSCDGCIYYPGGETTNMHDCIGFVNKLLDYAEVDHYGAGCTTMWNHKANWDAQGPISEMPDTVCCVFRQNGTKMEHIGLHIGGGWVIHCSVEVKKQNNYKWTHYGIPKGMGGVVPVTHKTIRRGSSGPDVVECQQDLIYLGYDLSPYGADGKFGAKTEAAVKSFQSTHTDQYGNPLKADGVVGSGTWWALDDAVKHGPEPKLYTVHIPHQNADQCEKLKVLYPDCWTTEE
jgi:hypothetical protein